MLPRLTTMAVDKLGMGRLAVALLLHRLVYSDAAPVQTLLQPRLIERDLVAVQGALADGVLS